VRGGLQTGGWRRRQSTKQIEEGRMKRFHLRFSRRE
jgi:hypothetical protein